MKQSAFKITLLLLLFVAACGKKDAPEEALPPNTQEEIPVKVMTVGKENTAVSVTASGAVSSDTEARLSFKTGGVIDQIYVDEGSSVKKGQLLAKLNFTEINAQVSQANQAIQKAERDLQRAQNLYRDSVATLEQVQNATTALQVAKENGSIAKFNRSYSEIRAPISGKILKKWMNEGEVAGPGNPVFMMHAASSNDWVVKAGITDKDFVKLKVGNQANITFDAYPNQVFVGTVKELPESADAMSGLYPVEFNFNTQGKKFTYGMFATIKLGSSSTNSSDYVAVPIDAIIEGNGANAFVFVPEGNKVKKTPVRIAFLKDEQALIASGLTAGTQVITDGSAYLTEKSIIKIIK